MTSPRLLIVSPGFHDYWRSVQDAFTRRGYVVTTHVYDRVTHAGKVRHKVSVELPQRLGARARPHQKAQREAVSCLQTVAPDALLVIKGDTLGEEFWSAASTIERRALWLYDELRRTAHTPHSLSAAGAIGSYSPADVDQLSGQGLPATHVPLAFDHTLAVTAQRRDEVAFVGARYPGREKLMRHLLEARVPVRAYGRDWSPHIVDRLRTWRLRSAPVPAGRDLTLPQAYGVMAGAAAALNIHGDQDGFTMRTFEIPGVGGLELIDRSDISAHYTPGEEVVVFQSPDEAIDLARRALTDRLWARRIAAAGKARTLAEHTFDHRAATLESLWA